MAELRARGLFRRAAKLELAAGEWRPYSSQAAVRLVGLSPPRLSRLPGGSDGGDDVGFILASRFSEHRLNFPDMATESSVTRHLRLSVTLNSVEYNYMKPSFH